MVMTQLAGPQLMAEVYKNWPQTQRILITGYADMDSLVRGVNLGKVFHYLSKPWKANELVEAVESAYQNSHEWVLKTPDQELA